MELQPLLFWIFSLAMLVSGLVVITRHNPVNSAMFLIQLLLCMAGLFLLLEAFFLAIVQILVYAGAVMVLFLFVIMLLDIPSVQDRSFPRFAVLGATVLGVGLGAEFLVLLRKPLAVAAAAEPGMTAGLADVVKPLFTNYLLPFELTALILIVALIGVIVVSKKETA